MLLNAFPLQIVASGCLLKVTDAYREEVLFALEDGSAIGHADTAAVLADILGVTVPTNRVTLPLDQEAGDVVVAQYNGPRLPEGATTLPAGATITFRRVMWRRPTTVEVF